MKRKLLRINCSTSNLMIGMLLILSIQTTFAQPIYDKKNKSVVDGKVKRMNELFGGVCKITIEKGQMTVDFIRGAGVYRQDKMYLETLDPANVNYSTEENALIVRCRQDLDGVLKKFEGGCIDRNFTEKGIRRAYGRANFDITYNEETVSELISLFQELINMAQPVDE